MAALTHPVVAGPYEYLSITGCKIPGVKLAKKAIILPGQQYTRYTVSPLNYTLEVQAMTVDRLPFTLPVFFSVGPNVNDEDSLVLYTNLVNSYHVNLFVQGIIKFEIREFAASMTIEEIVKGIKDFKKKVFGKVELALSKFGLIIYNANFEQLDVSGHKYFSTQMEAANQAKIDVFQASMQGVARASQNAVEIDAETTNIMRDSHLSMLMESLLDFAD